VGEYWKPVNIDKREQVHPHNVDDGLKRGEWMYWDDDEVELAPSATNKRVAHLVESGMWAEDDEVRAVSDCGGAAHLRGKQTDRKANYFEDWRDVSTDEDFE
jgi:hypothetical protein